MSPNRMETKGLTELVQGMYGRIQVSNNLRGSQEDGILARRLAIEEKWTPGWDRGRGGSDLYGRHPGNHGQVTHEKSQVSRIFQVPNEN
jgi:hypothetical protein